MGFRTTTGLACVPLHTCMLGFSLLQLPMCSNCGGMAKARCMRVVHGVACTVASQVRQDDVILQNPMMGRGGKEKRRKER